MPGSVLSLSKSESSVMVEFDMRLTQDGNKETIFRDKETQKSLHLLSKENQRQDSEVKSKEMIFINKKEYRNGMVELDQTKIKQRIPHKELEIDTLQKMFNTSEEIVDKNTEERKNMKYIFALRYYEQLGMATKNFLSLASLATSTGRHLVTPFVNNSRFCGLQLGVSMSRFMEATKIIKQNGDLSSSKKFTDIGSYFDKKHLKYQLDSRGYSKLASFQQFRNDCTRLDVVIHFLYNDPTSYKDLEKWYKLKNDKIERVKQKVRENNGWTDCGFAKRSRIATFLGNIQVSRYVCVDPEIIKTTDALEELVLKNAKCVAIVSWKGNGTKRTHFPLAPQVNDELRPSHIRHSKKLIDIAYDYIRNTIKRPFISVHVRIERHLKWKGFKAALTCVRRLGKAIQQRKSRLNLKKVFLAHDIGEYGSDTLQRFSDEDELTNLQTELNTTMGKPFRFDPKPYGLYDRGQIAIVEMHILSLGESLFTLGRGNFQEWIIDLFLLQNAEDRSLINKVCNLEKR